MPAQTFVEAQDRARTQPQVNPFTNQQRKSPKPRQNNSAGLRGGLVDRRLDAESMKFPPPPTVLKQEPITSREDIFAPLEISAAGMQRTTRVGKQQRHPRLDDTESIRSFSDSSASNVPEQQAAYDLGYEKNPRKSLRRAENRKAQGRSDKQPQYYGLSDFVEPEWQAHVAEEKRRLGLLSSDPVEDDNARGFDEDEYDQYNDFEVDQKGDLRIPGQGIVLRDTPSKAPGVPPTAPPTQPSIIKDQPAPVPAKTVSQPDVQKHSTRSSSIGSSDEEIRLPPQQPQLGKHPKRPHSEVESLDYDPFVLKTMTYADLERVMYTTDPRTPVSKPTVDTHGLALALPDKLANMSRMQQVDIKSMFETQTDAERQETGAWFVAEMTEMMKNVVKVRVERRKLALGFEMEARRRQKLVEMKTAELEGELKGLKTGGGELIANRKSHGKGVGKTGNSVA